MGTNIDKFWGKFCDKNQFESWLNSQPDEGGFDFQSPTTCLIAQWAENCGCRATLSYNIIWVNGCLCNLPEHLSMLSRYFEDKKITFASFREAKEIFSSLLNTKESENYQ